MKNFIYLFTFIFLSVFLTSWTSSYKRDALDAISVYQGEKRIGIWREFSDPVQAEIVLNGTNDTLLFWCSSDVRWMDSSSLFLTTNNVPYEGLFLSFDDSTYYSERYLLPSNRIAEDIDQIEVWRKTERSKQIVFQLKITREKNESEKCACLDSLYLLKKQYRDRIQLDGNGKVSYEMPRDEMVDMRGKITKQASTCEQINQEADSLCPARLKIDQLDEDLELIQRVIEMNNAPRGCNEIDSSDK